MSAGLIGSAIAGGIVGFASDYVPRTLTSDSSSSSCCPEGYHLSLTGAIETGAETIESTASDALGYIPLIGPALSSVTGILVSIQFNALDPSKGLYPTLVGAGVGAASSFFGINPVYSMTPVAAYGVTNAIILSPSVGSMDPEYSEGETQVEGPCGTCYKDYTPGEYYNDKQLQDDCNSFNVGSCIELLGQGLQDDAYYINEDIDDILNGGTIGNYCDPTSETWTPEKAAECYSATGWSSADPEVQQLAYEMGCTNPPEYYADQNVNIYEQQLIAGGEKYASMWIGSIEDNNACLDYLASPELKLQKPESRLGVSNTYTPPALVTSGADYISALLG